MTLETLIYDYGYYAIFIGAFLEGETVLVLGGFLAHQGYLHLPAVIGAAFLGGLLGDQLYFYLGRTQGARLLQRWPRLERGVVRVREMLIRRDAALILVIRFLYGLRIAGPVAIGMAGIRPVRFLMWNAVGALIWALGVCYAGYLFGHGLEVVLADAKHYETAALVTIAAGGAIAWAVYWLRTRWLR